MKTMTTKKKTKPASHRPPSPPALRFSPPAWGKLLFLRDRGETEIGGFGIAAEDDLLFIEDVVTVKQEASVASVFFDDEAVADLFEAQVDAGRKPEQFARAWIHTHPGASPTPSQTDEETFQRVFGGCDWAIMFVLAQEGKTHARLRFNIGPGGETVLPVHVDFSRPFAAADFEAWESEYQANIKTVSLGRGFGYPAEDLFGDEFGPHEWDDARLADVFDLDPDEREMVLQHLAHAADPEEAEEVLSAYYGEI